MTGADRVGVGVVAQHVERPGEVGPGFGEAAAAAQCPAELDAGAGGAALVADRHRGGDGPFRRRDRRCRRDRRRGVGAGQEQRRSPRIGRIGRLDEVGGFEVRRGGPCRRSGASGALGGPGEAGHGELADVGDVGVVGDGVHRVDEVSGDHGDDLFPVTGEDRPQVGGDGEVARLAITSRQRLVGDLAEQILGEAVTAPLGRQRVGRDLEHLAADQLAQRGGRRRLVEVADRDDRVGRERRAEHRRGAHHPPGHRVETVQAGREQRVQAVGHLQRADVTDEPVDAIDWLHDIAIDQRPDALHRVQRDPLTRATIASRAAIGAPGTKASTSVSIDAASSGSRVMRARLRPDPKPG